MIPAISTLLSPLSSIGGISKSVGIGAIDEINTAKSSVSIPAKMMQSILQSLEKLPSKSPQIASQSSNEPVNNFIQLLVEAIQSQQSTNPPTPANPAAKAFNQQNQFEQGLQSLIDQLTQQGNLPSRRVVEELGQSADQLFSSVGAPTGQQALGQFLNSLQQSFAGSSPIGNILSTQA